MFNRGPTWHPLLPMNTMHQDHHSSPFSTHRAICPLLSLNKLLTAHRPGPSGMMLSHPDDSLPGSPSLNQYAAVSASRNGNQQLLHGKNIKSALSGLYSHVPQLFFHLQVITCLTDKRSLFATSGTISPFCWARAHAAAHRFHHLLLPS